MFIIKAVLFLLQLIVGAIAACFAFVAFIAGIWFTIKVLVGALGIWLGTAFTLIAAVVGLKLLFWLIEEIIEK